MDVLWRRQTNLPTILKTLPADSWSVDDGGAFVRKKFLSCLRRKPYLVSSPCRGTSPRKSGIDSEDTPHV